MNSDIDNDTDRKQVSDIYIYIYTTNGKFSLNTIRRWVKHGIYLIVCYFGHGLSSICKSAKANQLYGWLSKCVTCL